jgi:hypothetical protein
MTTPKSMQQGTDMFSGLQKMLGDLAQLQAVPGADIEFLTQIQQVIVGKLQSMGQGQGGQQQQPQAGQQAGPPGQPQQASPSPMGGPAMGLSQTGNVGNMDELSRVLGGASQAG